MYLCQLLEPFKSLAVEMENIGEWNLIDLAESEDDVLEEYASPVIAYTVVGMLFPLEVLSSYKHRVVIPELEALLFDAELLLIIDHHLELFHLLSGDGVPPYLPVIVGDDLVPASGIWIAVLD